MKTTLSFFLLVALNLPASAQELTYRKDIRPFIVR